jgi:septum formation protein
VTRNPQLVLASASSRRSDILASLGVKFVVQPADVDEQRLRDEQASDMVLRLACDKALSVAGVIASPCCVLGADTAVLIDDAIFGKPQDEREGIAMLLQLSGRIHTVLTGVVVVARGAWSGAVSSTEVRFREIDPDEARRYWHSGEPCGKAGGYAIQGYGGLFVESISGSYTGVVGLPVFETGKLLRDAGIDVLPGKQYDR